MKNDNSIDELFREKLQNYQQEPPASLFDEILAGAARERNRRKIIYWRIAGVAAALLLAFIAGWQFSDRNQQFNQKPVFAEQETVAEKPDQVPASQNEEVVATNQDEFSAKQEPGINTDQVFANSNNSTAPAISEKSNSTAASQGNLTATSVETTLLKPLKSLYRLLEQTKAENELWKRRAIEARGKQLMKTIDQQIMEQNQKNYLAALSVRQKGRWLVGAQVSPAFSVESGSYAPVYASNMINSSKVNPIDLGGGFSVEYKTSKRLSVQSGIYYAGIGQSSGNYSASSGRDLLTADGVSGYFNAPVAIEADKVMMNSAAGVIELNGVPPSLVMSSGMDDKSFASNAVMVSDARFIQNFQYIEVPVYLRYALLDSRFGLDMLGGFSSNVLIGNDTYLENSAGRSLIGITQDMRTFNYSATLGLGFRYGLNKHFSLNVEPRVKYFLNSLNSNSSVRYKPYIFGIYTGVSYEF